MKIGYNKPLYVLPFDHRSSFEKGLFGWTGALSKEQVEAHLFAPAMPAAGKSRYFHHRRNDTKSQSTHWPVSDADSGWFDWIDASTAAGSRCPFVGV